MATKTNSTAENISATAKKTAQPPKYNVIMHNDDYTTMEFVIETLQSVFHKNPTEATHLMLTIHQKGNAICGCYSYEIAETKIAQAHKLANAAGHPLRCSMDRI
ncbi:MAG: ATP-dependent Clp protease adaptor ClpS [Desulfuromonas sp.]|nr:ATP-dependent Clp protease adaptor ClpS [Desulfuromonas sp.]